MNTRSSYHLDADCRSWEVQTGDNIPAPRPGMMRVALGEGWALDREIEFPPHWMQEPKEAKA